MMVPSVKWLKDSGKLSGIKIVTEGGSSNAFTMIKAGDVVAAVAGLPFTEAANGTQAAIDVLAGKKVSVPGFDAKTKVADYLRDPIFKGKPPVITADNVADFTAEWAAG
jgi:ABC-type sugar transport system substrate-binding protein